MYKILWDYGSEGWGFSEDAYTSASDALAIAMMRPNAPFIVVKIVEFRELAQEEAGVRE